VSRIAHVKLGDCCDIVSGATPSTEVKKYWGGDIFWATPKDLSSLDSKYLHDTAQKLTQAGYESCSARIMPAGSVLFSSRAPIGHVAMNAVPMCTNQGFKSLVPDPGRLSSDYLYHWLRANKIYLQSLGNGATFKEISKSTISAVEIPLPPVIEQQRIAMILDKADALRAKRREAIARLDQLLKSVFVETFGDPNGSSTRWPVCGLAEVTEFQEGPGILAKDFREEGVPLIRMAGLNAGRVSLKGCNFVDDQMVAKKWSHFRLVAGDILLLTSASFGNPAVVDAEAAGSIFYTGIIRFKPSTDKVDAGYLKHFLASPWFSRQSSAMASGAVIKHFGPTHLRQMTMPVPPIDVQQRFVRFAQRIEEIHMSAYGSTRSLDQLFDSLQQRLFTSGD
jgi:type I restriction enzyme S subunit